VIVVFVLKRKDSDDKTPTSKTGEYQGMSSVTPENDYSIADMRSSPYASASLTPEPLTAGCK